MAADPTKLSHRLSALDASLDELEAQLEPLFSQTLPETILALDNVQQAKLQVLLPYVVNGLAFAYLKAQGIDPKTHPVVNELERVRQYFEKIKDAENPDKRKTAVDKDAANRFIAQAIRQAQNAPVTPPIPSAPGPSVHIRFDGDGNPIPASTSATQAPIKVTSKMRERELYEEQLKREADEESEESEGLEVVDDEDEDEDEAPEQLSTSNKGKTKEPPRSFEEAPVAGVKRRRPIMDAFAGYERIGSPNGEQTASAVSSGPGTDTEIGSTSSATGQPVGEKKRKKPRKNKSAS